MPDIVVIFNPVPVAASEQTVLIAADGVGEDCDKVQILQIVLGQILVGVVVHIVEGREGGPDWNVGVGLISCERRTDVVRVLVGDVGGR